MVGGLVSFWENTFSGAMLVSGRVFSPITLLIVVFIFVVKKSWEVFGHVLLFFGSSNWNTQRCPRCLESTGIEKIRLIQRWETYLEVEEGWSWGWKTLSHGIHVWYIYLHLVDFYGFHVGKYTIHGSYGHGKTPRFFTWFLRTKEWIDVVLFHIEQTTFGM